jgi:phosphopantetheinyl transferase (holo-ACP synthase)
MGVAVATDSQTLSVQAMRYVHGRESVFYASLPCGPGAGATHKQRLVATLLERHAAMETPLRKDRPSANRVAFPIEVVCGPLGRPFLLLGEDPGPAISFSQCDGKVWAALCGDAFDIGIDVAGADEFRGAYPFDRVFHAQELGHALKVAGGDLEKAAALLWSIKEAVVKALGCGFHRVDPLQIMAYPADATTAENDAYAFAVGLSGKAAGRFPLAAGRCLWVRALCQGKRWLSIALLNRQLC